MGSGHFLDPGAQVSCLFRVPPWARPRPCPCLPVAVPEITNPPQAIPRDTPKLLDSQATRPQGGAGTLPRGGIIVGWLLAPVTTPCTATVASRERAALQFPGTTLSFSPGPGWDQGRSPVCVGNPDGPPRFPIQEALVWVSWPRSGTRSGTTWKGF